MVGAVLSVSRHLSEMREMCDVGADHARVQGGPSGNETSSTALLGIVLAVYHAHVLTHAISMLLEEEREKHTNAPVRKSASRHWSVTAQMSYETHKTPKHKPSLVRGSSCARELT